MAGEAHEHHLVQRLADRRATHRRRGKAYRVVFAIAGFTVTGVGVILLVTPGPALVILPIGLAMLALEFAWAERMLHHAIVRADAAKQRAAATNRLERALGAVATALAIAAIVTAGVLWDLPLLPL